jgi:hypothetical protein
LTRVQRRTLIFDGMDFPNVLEARPDFRRGKKL